MYVSLTLLHNLLIYFNVNKYVNLFKFPRSSSLIFKRSELFINVGHFDMRSRYILKCEIFCLNGPIEVKSYTGNDFTCVKFTRGVPSFPSSTSTNASTFEFRSEYSSSVALCVE